jgi:hypothetical protein
VRDMQQLPSPAPFCVPCCAPTLTRLVLDPMNPPSARQTSCLRDTAATYTQQGPRVSYRHAGMV